MKKASVILLMLVVLLTACSSSKSVPKESAVSSSAAGTDSGNANAIVDLPIFSYLGGSASQDFQNNDLTRFVEDQFKVKIKWSLVAQADVIEKQNVLLASGNYPPVMFGDFSQNDQIKYGKNGLFIPLNDLIDKYGSNIQKAFDKSPYLKQGVVSPDGNIYSLPGLEECYHCDYAQKLYLNTEWLKKLNLQMPTTTDELEKVLLAFKNNDPNGNGKKDEIALTGATKWWHGEPTGFLMNAFIYDDEANYLNLTNGKVDIPADKPQWKDGLTYIKKLYSEGLIDPQAYTQPFEGLQKTGDDPNVIMGAFTGGCCVPSHNTANGVWTQYEVLPPVKGPAGNQTIGYYGGSVNNGIFAITNKASEEQKIAAIKMVDYFYSDEGSVSEMYGPKGIGWTPAKDGELGIDGKPAIYDAEEPDTRIDKKVNVTWDMDLKYTPAEIFNGRAQSQDIKTPEGFERYLAVQTDKLVSFKPKETFPLAIWFNPDDAQKIAQMKTDIIAYIQTNTLQFITGQKDLDKDWNAYVDGFKGLKLDEYLKYNQEAYDKQYKK